ncbi:Histo-blood group ABO system transferase-like [Pseudomonas sp. IT-196MI5]
MHEVVGVKTGLREAVLGEALAQFLPLFGETDPFLTQYITLVALWEEDNQTVGNLGSLERLASPDNFPNHKLPRTWIELAHKVNVPGTEALIAEPGPPDHLEAVYPVDRYEVPVVHWYEMPAVHWCEMPVSHMKRATVEMVELPALLCLPTGQNGRVRILTEAATADCLQGKAACQKPRDQEQELLEDTHSATSDGPPTLNYSRPWTPAGPWR